MKDSIWKLINDSEKILVMAHESPDGDAIGSSMAFYLALKNMHKVVDIVIPELPSTFSFLEGTNDILTTSDKEYDLAIVVDCATKEGDTASCCQVIYYLFKDWNIEITKPIGEALLSGSLTDTNGFRNNNVDKNTFLMAADMVDYGIDIHKIYYLVLSLKTMPQYMLMKMTLDRLEMFEDGKIAFSYISHEDMENVGAKKGDHEGLVDIGRNIGGVEVSIFMREEDGYRISFRSNGKVNVNEIAKKFGGGGHMMAAGARVNDNFKETKDKLIEETIKELNK